MKWPGLAAVVVSVLHVHKGDFPGVKLLDGEAVDTITAFLFHRGAHVDPARLKANAGKSFVGSYVLGMGFTFDDSDTKGVATPLAEMRRLIEEEPRSREAIFPYIGGEEVNTSPTHAHHRFVINFRDYPLRRENLAELWADVDEDQRHVWLRNGIVPPDYPEPVAADWPDLLTIVEQKARGTRGNHSTAPWWQFERLVPRAIRGYCRSRPCAGQLPGKRTSPVRFRADQHGLCAHNLRFPLRYLRGLLRPPVPPSRNLGAIPRILARRPISATPPSDCFETFPFPDGWSTHPDLERAGTDYYRLPRESHVPTQRGPDQDVQPLPRPRRDRPRNRPTPRPAHRHGPGRPGRLRLDRHSPPTANSSSTTQIDEEDWGTRKKPYRYRWPDDVRDEVLARLLELNAERANEEALVGASGAGTARSGRSSDKQSNERSRRGHTLTQPTLWDHSGDG